MRQLIVFANPPCLLLLAICLNSSSFSMRTHGATFTWNSGTGNWNSNANWSPNSGNPNATTDVAVFANTGTTSVVNVNRAVGTVIFNIDGDFDVAGTSLLSLNNRITATSPTPTGRTYSVAAPITFTSDVIFAVGANTTLSLSGTLDNTSSQGFTKTGDGLVIISSALNSYDGAVILSAGTVQISSIANVGVNSAIGGNSGVNISGGALKYVGSGHSTTRSFSLGGSGGIIDASGTGSLNFTSPSAISVANNITPLLTFTGDSGFDNTFRPTIGNSNGQNATSLTKGGSGKWILSGNNSYNGATTISGGTLIINGTHAGTGNVTVSDGASLGGTGTLNGDTTVNTGGTLAPGESAGRFTFDSTLTLQSNAILEMEIGSAAAPGTTYDQVLVRNSGANSMVTGGAILKLIGLPGIQTGVPYTIVSATTTSTINSTGLLRNGSALGALMSNATAHSQNGMSFTIDYSSSAISVTFSAVPEPSTLGLAMLAAPVLLRRRRRV